MDRVAKIMSSIIVSNVVVLYWQWYIHRGIHIHNSSNYISEIGLNFVFHDWYITHGTYNVKEGFLLLVHVIIAARAAM